jgi:hypothetical protein
MDIKEIKDLFSKGCEDWGRDDVEYLLYLLNRADEHLNALYKAKTYDECQNIVNNYMIKGNSIV